MLGRIAGILPVASLVAVLAVAIFNFGYFWYIGLHFIGLIDLSNLAYSLGLALSTILLVGQVGYTMFMIFDQPWTREREKKFYRRSNTLLIIGGVFVVVAFAAEAFHVLPTLAIAMPGFFGFLLCSIGLVLGMMVRQKKDQPQKPENFGLLCFVIVGLIFTAGMVACDLEISEKTTYQVTTKNEVIENVHILRSSSSGFVILANDKVNFIPQGEVKRIISNLQLR